MKRTNGIFSAITKAVFILLFPSSYVITSMAQVPVPVKPRILISTDIGGTDPDDNQSMAHYLMYSNLFNTEGLVSSPSYGSGNVSEILRMIDLYEKDLPQLKKKADGFPAPDYLRSISKQGRAGAAPYCGFQTATEGSDWIVRCARKEVTSHYGCLCGEAWMMWPRHCTMPLTFRRRLEFTGSVGRIKSGAPTVMPT